MDSKAIAAAGNDGELAALLANVLQNVPTAMRYIFFFLLFFLLFFSNELQGPGWKRS